LSRLSRLLNITFIPPLPLICLSPLAEAIAAMFASAANFTAPTPSPAQILLFAAHDILHLLFFTLPSSCHFHHFSSRSNKAEHHSYASPSLLRFGPPAH